MIAFLAGAAVALLAAGGVSVWVAWRACRIVGEALTAVRSASAPVPRLAEGAPSRNDQAEAERLRSHDTDSPRCWCKPECRCLDCYLLEPCAHGVDRDMLVVHRRAS